MKLKTFFKFIHPKCIWNSTQGTCTVCGKRTIFLIAEPLETIRNHAQCVWCKSASRHRHIAKCVFNNFTRYSISNLNQFRNHSDLVVFNASSKSSIAKQLGKAPNIFNTEYFDNCPSGSYQDGVLCQDLENLSFNSNSIDLVITEDVFEHVRDIYKAFHEVYRVLKKGGYHIFSIPFFFDQKTKPLFDKKGDQYILHEPVEYHGDSIRERIPAYYHIGYDIFDYLRKIGFDVSVEIAQYHDYKKYGAFNCFTFVTKKVSS